MFKVINMKTKHLDNFNLGKRKSVEYLTELVFA